MTDILSEVSGGLTCMPGSTFSGGVITTGGHNLVGKTNGTITDGVNGDIVNPNPKLGTLGSSIGGSSATGVKWRSGEPFNAESDIDLAVVDSDLFAKAKELGVKLWGGGTRTPPLSNSGLEDLGLRSFKPSSATSLATTSRS